MTQEQIKEKAEEFYSSIKSAEQGLKALRALCKHPNTFEGIYYFRPGSGYLADICSDCGQCLTQHPANEAYKVLNNLNDQQSKL